MTKRALLRILGRNARRHRIAARLSQREVAIKSGLSAASISAIERCQTAPRLYTLIALAEGLGVQVADLLRFELRG